jgi:hypothetical protein
LHFVASDSFGPCYVNHYVLKQLFYFRLPESRYAGPFRGKWRIDVVGFVSSYGSTLPILSDVPEVFDLKPFVSEPRDDLSEIDGAGQSVALGRSETDPGQKGRFDPLFRCIERIHVFIVYFVGRAGVEPARAGHPQIPADLTDGRANNQILTCLFCCFTAQRSVN